jgi:hypothetical protein
MKMASPIQIVRLPASPLAHDDSWKRDDFASRGFCAIADIAVICWSHMIG